MSHGGVNTNASGVEPSVRFIYVKMGVVFTCEAGVVVSLVAVAVRKTCFFFPLPATPAQRFPNKSDTLSVPPALLSE